MNAPSSWLDYDIPSRIHCYCNIAVATSAEEKDCESHFPWLLCAVRWRLWDISRLRSLCNPPWWTFFYTLFFYPPREHGTSACVRDSSMQWYLHRSWCSYVSLFVKTVFQSSSRMFGVYLTQDNGSGRAYARVSTLRAFHI